MKYINNCSTGEVVVREMTDDEINAETQQAELYAEKLANEVAEAEAKAQAKAELLERLGITADEAKLLLA
jgi:hypothetical protein